MGLVSQAFQLEGLNFLVTNRIPRQLATRALGRISRVENERFTDAAVRVWRLFAPELDLDEAASERFASLREVFVRELKPGVRPIAAGSNVVVSPCDGMVVAHGRIEEGMLIQAKGLDYSLSDLLCDDALARFYENGCYVTLRLKSTMYHRFHAPAAGRIRKVNYISGDTWNVNPVALKRVERLYCRNERAVLPIELAASGGLLTLVPVAAIGVATMRLHCLGASLGLDQGRANRFECDATVQKGDELGWFEQGSTIIVLGGEEMEINGSIDPERVVRVGEPLLTATGQTD